MTAISYPSLQATVRLNCSYSTGQGGTYSPSLQPCTRTLPSRPLSIGHEHVLLLDKLSFYQSRRYRALPPSLSSTPSLPSRLGTQRDDFTLLAERVKKQQRRTLLEDDFFSSAGSLPRHLLHPSISLGGLQASLHARSTVRATSRSPRLSIRYIQTAFLTASLVHRPHPAHVRGLGLGTRLPNFMALSE